MSLTNVGPNVEFKPLQLILVDDSIRNAISFVSDKGLRLVSTPLLQPTGMNAGHLQLRTNQPRANRMGGRVFPNVDKRVLELFRDDTHRSTSAACAILPNSGLWTVLSSYNATLSFCRNL